MKLIPRLVFILLLMASLPLVAQESTAAGENNTVPAGEVAAVETSETAVAGEGSSYATRHRFTELLREHPRDLATILVLDPSLLTNAQFLAKYPAVGRFVAEHPEIQGNPHFYLGDFQARRNPPSVFDNVVEETALVLVILTIALAFVWLIRTVIDQRRWNRLSRTQSEVHNKILDRFGSTAELLEYVRSAAGAKFLGSAPIPLQTDRASSNPSLSRVIWSIQIGVVLAAAAIGLLLVSLRSSDEAAQGLFAMGVILFSIGGGFVASAGVSLFLSRRLGLWQPEADEETGLEGVR